MTPYVGGEIASLFAEQPAVLAMRRMAGIGAERLMHWAVINTPIGGRFGGSGVGGNLRTSWYTEDTKPRVGGGFTSGAATDVSYAPDVEYGTGLWGPDHKPYVIVPKKPGGWLHWIDPRTGKDVFAKRVVHPGSPGQHMMATAVAMVEAELEGTLMDDALAEWVRATEALAD